MRLPPHPTHKTVVHLCYELEITNIIKHLKGLYVLTNLSEVTVMFSFMKHEYHFRYAVIICQQY